MIHREAAEERSEDAGDDGDDAERKVRLGGPLESALGGAADNPASYASLVDAIVRAQAATDKREILKQKFVLYARDGTAAALRPLA